MPDVPPSAAAPVSPTFPIAAKADSFFRGKRYILVAALFFYGLWNVYDGFYRYPRDNAAARAKGYDVLPHPAYDVPLNRTLGVLLPPASILFLLWSVYASRGEIRFDGSTLSMPGHPPIPLNALRKMDRSKWERKGIAIFDYQLPGTTTTGTFKLDDFVYQRKPTDEIFAVLEAAILAAAGSPPGRSASAPVA